MTAPHVPDSVAIRDHLQCVTDGWETLDEPVFLELRALRPQRGPADVESFDLDSLDEAVEWARDRNEGGQNVYVLVNPKSATARGRAAKDADIVAAFFYWADADEDDAVAALASAEQTGTVVTGAVPSRREHAYWRLPEPERDLTAWRQGQRAIADAFGSDSAVTNPSRIMRLAGTVSYPSEAKQGRGYVEELVTGRFNPDVRLSLADILANATHAAGCAEGPSKQGKRSTDAANPFTQAMREELRPEQSPRLIDKLKTKRNVLSKRKDWLQLGFALHAGYVGTEWEEEAAEAWVDWCLRWETAEDRDPEQLERAARELWEKADPNGRVTAATAQMLIDAMPDREIGEGEHCVDEIGPLEPDDKDDANHGADSDTAKLEPFEPTELSEIPPTPWLYGKHHQRGAVTVTAAPGGIGKSMLAVAEAISMATGQSLVGGECHGRRRVWYISGEENERTLSQRMNAALVKHGVSREELGDRLFVTSAEQLHELLGGSPKLVVASRDGPLVNEQVFNKLVEIIIGENIDVVTIDPLKKFHSVDENDNTAMDVVADVFRRIAEFTNAGIELIHHGTKEARRSGRADGATGIRGASSLVDAARSARTLVPMSEELAKKLSIEEPDQYVQILDAKSNNAKKSSKARAPWFRIETVDLDNSNTEYPNGDSVGVAVRWRPPAPDPNEELEFKMQAFNTLPSLAGQFKAHEQSDDWLGHAVAAALALDIGRGRKKADRTQTQEFERSRVRDVITEFIIQGLIKRSKISENGRSVPILEVDCERVKKRQKNMKMQLPSSSPAPTTPPELSGVGE